MCRGALCINNSVNGLFIAEVAAVAQGMITDLSSRIGSLQPFMSLAIACDPRTKNYQGFLSPDEIREVDDLFRQEFSRLGGSFSVAEDRVVAVDADSTVEGIFNQKIALSGSRAVSEWDHWMVTSPALAMKDDAFAWWKSHEQDFPTIAQIARMYLCIPASSVPSERVFSAAGNILSAKRCNMSPQLLRDSVLCYENRHLAPGCAEVANLLSQRVVMDVPEVIEEHTIEHAVRKRRSTQCDYFIYEEDSDFDSSDEESKW